MTDAPIDIYDKLREQTRNIDWSKVHVDSDKRAPLDIAPRRRAVPVSGSGVRFARGFGGDRKGASE